jgi:hypothetical protein
MRIHGTKVLVIAGGLILGTAALADGMTHAQFETGENAIEAEYKAAKKHCDSLSGRAEDVCEAEAKGVERVAKADLRVRYEPTASHVQDARNARIEATYSVAMERCEVKSGNAENVCEKEAKAVRVHALSTAEARAATSSAEYSLAKERCDALAGDSKDRCIDDAKARFSQQ